MIEDKLREAESALQVSKCNPVYLPSKAVQGLLRSQVALEHQEKARVAAEQIDREKCLYSRINIWS